YIEKAVKLKAQVKGAMVYPVAVISIAGIVVAVILWKVIPTFASMFEGLGAQLPLPTRIVIALSNWFVRLLPFMIIALVLLVVLFRRYYATYGGRRTIDRTILKLPILGVIMQKIAVARFCRTLSTLISSGVPILDGLEITARTSGNAIVEDAIMAVRKAVESGMTLAQPLKESGVFPPMVVQMIGVGEQTGAPPPAEGEGPLPADGRADDRRRRADGRARRDALQDRGLLRGRGGPGGGQPAAAVGAVDDHVPGHPRRRHRHQHVPAAVRPHQQADVSPGERGRAHAPPRRPAGPAPWPRRSTAG